MNMVKNDRLDIQLWYALHRTVDSIIKYEENAFLNTELTAQQFYVLVAIKYIHAPVTSKKVADWLDRNPNTITLIIDRMQKEGFVERVRNLKDRRASSLNITDKGLELYQQALDRANELPRKAFSDLSEDEMTMLSAVLTKICNNTYQLRRITKEFKEFVIPAEWLNNPT